MKLFLNNFWLKIIAMITMTIDHIGFMLQTFFKDSVSYNVGYTFRIIGRIALPLFIFLAVEGALHTKDIKKYIFRLVLILVPILLVQVFAEFVLKQRFYQGNIFIDLVLVVLMVYLLELKEKKLFKLFLIPIFLYGIFSLICFGYEYSNDMNVIVWAFPYFLRCQYDVFSLLLGLVIYLSKKYITPLILKGRGLNPILYKETNMYKLTENIIVGFSIIIISLLQYAITKIPNIHWIVYWDASIQIWAILSVIFILFYNGLRGYNKKWFKIFSYVYYPGHLLLLYGIFMLIVK